MTARPIGRSVDTTDGATPRPPPLRTPRTSEATLAGVPRRHEPRDQRDHRPHRERDERRHRRRQGRAELLRDRCPAPRGRGSRAPSRGRASWPRPCRGPGLERGRAARRCRPAPGSRAPGGGAARGPRSAAPARSSSACTRMESYSPAAMEMAPAISPARPARRTTDGWRIGPGDAQDQAHVADQPVADPEHRGAGRAALDVPMVNSGCAEPGRVRRPAAARGRAASASTIRQNEGTDARYRRPTTVQAPYPRDSAHPLRPGP